MLANIAPVDVIGELERELQQSLSRVARKEQSQRKKDKRPSDHEEPGHQRDSVVPYDLYARARKDDLRSDRSLLPAPNPRLLSLQQISPQ